MCIAGICQYMLNFTRSSRAWASDFFHMPKHQCLFGLNCKYAIRCQARVRFPRIGWVNSPLEVGVPASLALIRTHVDQVSLLKTTESSEKPVCFLLGWRTELARWEIRQVPALGEEGDGQWQGTAAAGCWVAAAFCRHSTREPGESVAELYFPFW